MRGPREIAAERLWWAWSQSLTMSWEDAAAVVLAELVTDRAERTANGEALLAALSAQIEDAVRALVEELAKSPEQAVTLVRLTAGR